MSAELPRPSSKELQRIERRINVPEIKSTGLTPEGVERVGLIADKIQGILEDAYGLKSLKLKKASQFLWPRVTSEAAEETIPLYEDNGAFYNR